MNKSQFSKLIKDFDFASLFNQLGWDNFNDTINPVTVEKCVFDVKGIAQKRGFAIVVCAPDNSGKVPESSVRRQIESNFSKYYHEHIIIYTDAKHTEQKWQYVINEENKPRRIREAEYHIDQDTEGLFQRLKNLVFTVSEEDNITLIDVLNKVRENFAKNSETVTKKFYDEFKKEHEQFMKYIKGIDDQIIDKENQNKQWYASLMMNRLMFCYFIQKRSFLDNNPNYLSDKLRECQQKHGNDKFFSFYRQFLLVLFHDALGKPEDRRSVNNIINFGKIPYLNGGLFDVHELEKQFDGIQIEDQAFVNVFKFFDQWQWHLDTSPHGDGRHINPDVIGYIFEKYINDRAKMGAYYTKEDITNYISQNCIIPFLFDQVEKEYPEGMAEDSYVWKTLKKSGDAYIYPAMKHGFAEGGSVQDDLPEDVLDGFDDELAEKIVSDDTPVHLWQKRQCWNRKVENSELSLPTETWRELIARREHVKELRTKISSGEIHSINDFITYNLNIRQFTQDILDNTDDKRFIEHFYRAVRKITVLDPTCGSGAFLFAALNILEPLYAACIDRIEDFVEEAQPGTFPFFEDELRQIHDPKHPNMDYFIYKNIILNNLYGVDIMKEAVEIAKLRLFLKLVGTVEVNPRKPNLGLEPLPDIDFNIRAGNTLVGYATEQELYNGMSKDLFTNQRITEFKERSNQVAQSFKNFQDAQIARQPYQEAKAKYQQKLSELNHELDLLLASNYGIDTKSPQEFEAWKQSHCPFHWFTEFYEIVANHGGFDVIIGNPPYVEYRNVLSDYRILDSYNTLSCGNLYAFVLERSCNILKSFGYMSFIIPLTATHTNQMVPLQNMFAQHSTHLAAFCGDTNPSVLFTGARMQLLICHIVKNYYPALYNTNYIRFYGMERQVLFDSKIRYFYDIDSINKYVGTFPKMANQLGKQALTKLFNNSKRKTLAHFYSNEGLYTGYYLTSFSYYARAFTFSPEFRNEQQGASVSSHCKTLFFSSELDRNCAIAIICSSLFYFYWQAFSYGRQLNSREVDNFPIDFRTFAKSEQLSKVALILNNDFIVHSEIRKTKNKRTGNSEQQIFFPKKSKPVMDMTDQILACQLELEEMELDFIINYDIKYRMGDETTS